MELRENIHAGIPEIDQEAQEAAIRMLMLAQEGRQRSENGFIGEDFGSEGRISSLGSPKTNSYIKDALGSTILLLDQNANIKERYSYAPFGSIDYQNGTSDNTKQFTGKEIDEESGLSYFGARYYNPEIGRWISRDILSGSIYKPQGLNRYIYCYNMPFVFLDPNGQNSIYVQVEGTGLGPTGNNVDYKVVIAHDIPTGQNTIADAQFNNQGGAFGDPGNTTAQITGIVYQGDNGMVVDVGLWINLIGMGIAVAEKVKALQHPNVVNYTVPGYQNDQTPDTTPKSSQTVKRNTQVQPQSQAQTQPQTRPRTEAEAQAEAQAQTQTGSQTQSSSASTSSTSPTSTQPNSLPNNNNSTIPSQ